MMPAMMAVTWDSERSPGTLGRVDELSYWDLGVRVGGLGAVDARRDFVVEFLMRK